MNRSFMRLAWILVFSLSVGHAYGAKPTGTTGAPVKSPPSTATTPGGPSLEAPEVTHDFGEVMEGSEVVYAFQVKNTGAAVLQIQQVRPG